MKSSLTVLWRPLAPIFIGLLLPAFLYAQQAPKTRIRDMRDILPPKVASRLQGKSPEKLLRTTQDLPVPIFVLVNPALLKGGKAGNLKALVRSWPGPKQKEFSPAVLKSLVENQGNSPAIHSCLVEIANDFFKLFFGANVFWNQRLSDLITKQYFKGEVVIVACFDVQCRPEGRRLAADLSLKIFRLEIDRNQPNPQPIKSLELLFQDQAKGLADLPQVETNEPTAGFIDQVRTAYQAALVNALDRKIALSLWYNVRMREASWVSNRRGKIITPALMGKPKAGTSKEGGARR